MSIETKIAKNRVTRNTFCNLFPKRQLVLLDNPDPDGADGNYEGLMHFDEDKVDLNYVAQVQNLCDMTIMHETAVKKFLSKPITGPMLAMMLQKFVDDLNKRDVIDLYQAFEWVLESEKSNLNQDMDGQMKDFTEHMKADM